MAKAAKRYRMPPRPRRAGRVTSVTCHAQGRAGRSVAASLARLTGVFDLVAARAPGLWQGLNLARLAVEGPLLRGGAVYRGSSRSAAVALTFDDGPDPRWTPRILEALARADARATFFFLASAMQAHPQLTREAAARHEIGTHLYDHSRAPMASASAFADSHRFSISA